MTDIFPENKIIILSSPSGGGKTTIVEKSLPDLDFLEKVITVTSRKPRQNETDGVDYFFTDDETFKKDIREGRFLEYAYVYGKSYGTLRSQVDDILSQGKAALLVIDVQGANSILQMNLPDVKSIFIMPPSKEILEQRLRDRKTETPDRINTRLAQYDTEMEQKDKFDFHIVNHSLKDSIDEFKRIVREICSKPNDYRPGN